MNRVNQQPLLTEPVYRDIIEAAQKFYDSFTSHPWHHDQNYVHRLPRCIEASAIMVAALSAKDYDIKVDSRDKHAGSLDGSYLRHDYPVITHQGIEVVIDPTWQQFLDSNSDTSAFPRVLIGSRATAVAQARYAGVSRLILPTWEPKK